MDVIKTAQPKPVAPSKPAVLPASVVLYKPAVLSKPVVLPKPVVPPKPAVVPPKPAVLPVLAVHVKPVAFLVSAALPLRAGISSFKKRQYNERDRKQKTSFSLSEALLKKRSFKNSGQVTVEYILLAVALLVLFQVAANSLKDNQALKNFQETPQKIFRNMVENGNWKVNEAESRKYHPNHYEFQYTDDGQGP